MKKQYQKFYYQFLYLFLIIQVIKVCYAEEAPAQPAEGTTEATQEQTQQAQPETIAEKPKVKRTY